LNSAKLALAAFATGGLLGAAFFVGLWWTVEKGLASRNHALWFAGSLMLRASLVLAGFYLFSANGWQGLTLCVLGFLTARAAVMRCTTPPLNSSRAP
jgi:F1F0 ATPase subunit 2